MNLDLPIVQLTFENGRVGYYGQDPRRSTHFIGRLDTEYGIKEGVFCSNESELGGMVMNGYGRFVYPSYCLEGNFARGVRVVSPTDDEEIPDSRDHLKGSLDKFMAKIDKAMVHKKDMEELWRAQYDKTEKELTSEAVGGGLDSGQPDESMV